MNKAPLIICDTGHNLEGLKYTLSQISRISRSILRFIIGFVSDKDIRSVLPLFPVDAVYYFTRASVPRAMDEKVLMAEAHGSGLNGSSFSDVKSALMAARADSSENDLIYVGGSTFIVADAINHLKTHVFPGSKAIL